MGIKKELHSQSFSRKNQNLQWFREGLSNQLLQYVFQNPKLSNKKKEIEQAIQEGKKSVKSGLEALLKQVFDQWINQV